MLIFYTLYILYCNEKFEDRIADGFDFSLETSFLGCPGLKKIFFRIALESSIVKYTNTIKNVFISC